MARAGLQDTPPEEGQGGQQAQQGLPSRGEGGRVAQVRATAPIGEAGHGGEHLGKPVVIAVRILDALAVDVATYEKQRNGNSYLHKLNKTGSETHLEQFSESG